MVGQGLTLPWLIRRLGVIEDGTEEEDEEIRARLVIARAALDRVDELETEDWTRDGTIERIRRLYEFRQRRFKIQAGQIEDEDGLEEGSLLYQRMMHEIYAAQRAGAGRAPQQRRDLERGHAPRRARARPGGVAARGIAFGHGTVALTDGGLETTLLFHEGFDLPCFAAFPLLDDDAGRAALRRYFEPFLDLAQERGLPFVLDTRDLAREPGLGRAARLRQRRARGGQPRCGRVRARARAGPLGRDDQRVLGPRGDGYVVGERMSADEAADYHAWQIGVLARGGSRAHHGVDAVLSRGGDRRRAGRRSGRPAGRPGLHGRDRRAASGRDARSPRRCEQVDAATDGAAEFFMVNCAHPTHIAAGLDGAPGSRASAACASTRRR